jgi:hypothetical protein
MDAPRGRRDDRDGGRSRPRDDFEESRMGPSPRRGRYDEDGGPRARRYEDDEPRPRRRRPPPWEDDEYGANVGERMVNLLTGRRRAVAPGANALPGAPAEEPKKEGAGRVQMTIFGLVVLAWLVGAGLGFMLNRPTAVSGATAAPTQTVAPSTTPNGTASPTTTTTPTH